MPDIAQVLSNILGSQEFTSLVLLTVTSFVGFIVTFAGWAWRKYVLGKLTQEELATLQRIATIAVQAAEQMGAGQVGEAKLALALDFATRQLNVYGIKVTPEQLRAAIEAALYATVTRWELTPPATVTDRVMLEVSEGA